jgi:putative transposase
MGKTGALDTIWEVPDDLWAEIEPVLGELDPPKKTGRPRMDARRALNGVIYRLRTSCQWNHLPERFGSDSAVHRAFQRWVEKGVFTRVWALLIQHCDDLGAVEWKWQAADGAMGKARMGGTSSGRIPRTGARPGRSEASWLRAMAVR